MKRIETQKQELEAVIDWVQVTFKELNHKNIMRYILQFDQKLMSYESRERFRYMGKWVFGGIEVLIPPKDYPDMGTHIYMTGSACRSFEIYLTAQKERGAIFSKIVSLTGVNLPGWILRLMIENHI